MKTIIFTLTLLLPFYSLAQNQNISQGVTFDGEPYLSINPENSNHLVVAWMGFGTLSNLIKIKTKVSFNGGSTWSTTVDLPHIQNNFTSADPCIAFNANGEIFLSYIDFTGFGVANFDGNVLIVKSTDGGLSWSDPTVAIDIELDAPRRPIDRAWMVIDRSSGSSNGNIYITTMNGAGANSPFHPYVSISKDNGNTFNWKELDGPNWLSGSIIRQPMPSPDISANGNFYAAYPSAVFTQNLMPQYVLASSNDGGDNFNYFSAIASQGTVTSSAPLAKKAQLFRANPADDSNLVLIYLDSSNGDLDIFFVESETGGASWSSPVRLNDDPIANNRMQDLIWADFDLDGDLVVSWRDRRNGTDSTYTTQTEIWGTVRTKDETTFGPNFQITSQTIAHDEVLEESGNDFMCIKLQNDTLNAVWGDPRNGELNIWYQRMTLDGTIVNIQELSDDQTTNISIFPNPTATIVNITAKGMKNISLFSTKGDLLFNRNDLDLETSIELDLSAFPIGVYFMEVHTAEGVVTQKIVRQ